MRMKVLWLSLVALACSLAFAQLPQEVLDMPLPHDPEILMGTLENGINYYIMQNSRPANRAELRLYVDAGSILEDEDQLGLAHFTEHMAFNGTTHFGRSEVVDYLASIGMGFANGLNAMTSYDFTMYQLKIPTDNKEQLEKGFLILSDMANKVSFHPDELESERGVIIEEWRMGQNAQSRIGNAVSKVRFAGSRYATRQPIGTYETLTTFQRDEIVRFYEDWYRPDLQSVVVIGDLEVEAARALVERHFGDIPARENPRPREIFEVPSHPAARAVVATDPEYPYSTISASWDREATTYQTVGDFYRDLHEQLFFNMLNARFEELIQDENPPFSMAYGNSGSMLKGLNSTELTAYTGEGRNREALRSLLTEAERVRQHGFTASELDRAKLRLMRGLEKAMESSSTRESGQIVWGIFSSLISGSVIMSAEQDLMLASQMIQAISLEAVNGVIDELITPENLTISYTATAKEGAIHPTEEQLLAVYGEVQASQIEAYEDNEVTEPLMAEIPQPGKIVNSKLHPKSGIKEWTLSNGVKVYSKKTDFKADEILFTAKSPGGYSRYDTARFHAAQSLGSYTASSGLGAFDSNDLSRVLAGKIASANLDVDTYYEGMSGSASPRDLEVMFQLINQNATKARFDQKSLTSFVNRYKPFLENAMNSPEQVFFDTLRTMSYNNHPMQVSLRAKHLEDLQIKQLQSVYSDRFADFSDFSFFFVGNFEEAQLEEYVKTYLGTLPSSFRKEKIYDAKILPFQGKKDVSFLKGSSESAYVTHVTTGKMKLTDKNKAEMSAMLMVLNEKLRENIREKMSGVYMIQAWQEYESFPHEHYTLSILLTCDPGRVEELSTAIFATVDSLRAGEFGERYVSSSKAVLQKRYEENISQNRYWMSNMANNTFGRESLDSFLEHPARYAKIDKKIITKAAKKYLRFDKDHLAVVMKPETLVR
ncbi:MAG: insulinase family protein [Candidatus Cloacimonetes bacterium]|nr:insulinase family protein [Candidatus Cloacimonadota bacterium]MDY0173239.1 insulinase family protein [Candidatus Cloacimonadaceae bacterium]